MTAKEKGVVYGGVKEVMAESRMKEFFGIDLRKVLYEEEGFVVEAMVPRDLGNERIVSLHR